MSYTDKINDVIDDSDVALFMKGTPAVRDVRQLRSGAEGAPPRGRVGDGGRRPPRPADPPGPVAISGWPTIPQVFVKGELVGGADIVEELERAASSRRRCARSSATTTAAEQSEKTVALV